VWTSRFADDVERVVAAGDRLIGSRPRHQQAGGVIVSEPLSTSPGSDVDVHASLEEWDVVTALETLSPGGDPCIAIGDHRRVGLFSIGDETLGAARWEVTVDFRPAALTWDGRLVWAAGSEPAVGVDDYDWEQLHGGGFVGLDPQDGTPVVEGRFDEDLAWGNGGAAVLVTPSFVCGVERTGALSLYGKRDGKLVARTPNAASHSLGIAHAAAIDDVILFGFNRAGYELRAVSTVMPNRVLGERA
jgi:hypothetical protein